MRSFRDLSLKHKLTLVLTLTSFLVLLAAFTAAFVFERASSHAALGQDLSSLAEVVSANSTAALTFEDARSATEILSTLRLRPNVVTAALYAFDGRVFAAYHRGDSPRDLVPVQAQAEGMREQGGHFTVFRPVIHDGQRVGTLYMKADMRDAERRLRRYGTALVILMVLGGLGAFLLAGRTQAVISRPILELARAAETVSQQKDYSLRVSPQGGDEIGGLTEAFNGMLTQIQARDGALQVAQKELEGRVQDLLVEVADRRHAQAALRQSEEQLRHQAFHDSLTGLPNRTLLNDRLRLALVQALRERRPLAVMFLDLDRFKLINDSLGHSVGDQLLRDVAARLQHTIREADTLARLGGDEFILVLPGIHGDADAARIAEKVLQSLRQPFRVEGREMFVSGSVGVSLFPSDGMDAETLVKNADVAMYRAKEQGRDTYHLYKPELHRRALDRMTLENQLRAATARKEFRLHYQPIVDFERGVIVGSEALLRWEHPERGLVMPAEFIPVAEEMGLIHSLGAWVMRAGCEEARTWEHLGLPPIRLSVNLSARQLQQEDLVAQIARILADTGLDPGLLDLEITESVAMENPDHTVVTLDRMKRLGLRLTIDDFGTGYSSLSYLKKFPLDTLKIDRSFVQDITSDPRNAAVAQAIIALGHGLAIDVIAEGVETEEQRLILKAHGCHALQGFLFSRPLPAPDFAEFLEARGRVRYN